MPSNIDRRGWRGEALPLVDQPPGTFIYPEPGLEKGILIKSFLVHGLASIAHTMGKHMSDAELDKLQAWKAQGLSLTDMRRRLMSMRAAARERGPSLMTIRRALRGSTFRRSKVETRGRKQI